MPAESDNKALTMTPRDLKRWRFELGLNQAEAAELLGLSQRTITAYEIGEYPIPLVVAYACHWLGDEMESER